MQVNKFTPDELEAEVEQADNVDKDTPLKGAPIDATVGTLLEYATEKGESVLIYTKRNRPQPLGMNVRIESLSELQELTDTFGTTCLTDTEEIEPETLDIGYTFD